MQTRFYGTAGPPYTFSIVRYLSYCLREGEHRGKSEPLLTYPLRFLVERTPNPLLEDPAQVTSTTARGGMHYTTTIDSAREEGGSPLS